MKFLAVLLLLLHLHYSSALEPKPFVTCPRKWVKVGCFHDSLSPRPLPNLLLNDRDVYSPANDGHVLDWHKWQQSLHSLTCRCAEKAREKGYQMFGLQFYGECWGGLNSEMLFEKDGPSNNCIQQLVKPHECVKSDPFTECVGGEGTNYIYRLTDNTPEPQSPDVDGGFKKWSEWTACSKTCGEGLKMRERECTNPIPKGNGRPCVSILSPAFEQSPCRVTECRGKCGRTMDVAFVIDSSASVHQDNFKKIKEFLVKLVSGFEVNEHAAHVAVVRYSHEADVVFNFGERKNYDKQTLLNHIKEIEYMPGGTRTDIGMKMAGRDLFNGLGARDNVPHIMMVLTDGRTSRKSESYSSVLKTLKAEVPGELKIIAVGVGGTIGVEELNEIADRHSRNVFKLHDFEVLQNKVTDIVNSFCVARVLKV